MSERALDWHKASSMKLEENWSKWTVSSLKVFSEKNLAKVIMPTVSDISQALLSIRNPVESVSPSIMQVGAARATDVGTGKECQEIEYQLGSERISRKVQRIATRRLMLTM